MNASIGVWCFGDSKPDLGQVEAIFQENERRFSRFDPESELSQLNAASGTKEVSKEMLEALMLSEQFRLATNGYFDITILNALERLGYDRSIEKVPANSVDPVTKGLNTEILNGSIWVDQQEHLVDRKGAKIDLGGIVKSLTIKKAAQFLDGMGAYLINAGGDIVTSGPHPEHQSGWQVDIIVPKTQTGFSIRLRDHALATSGISMRTWKRNGEQMNHIINPVSGGSSDSDLRMVSIIGPDVVEAEVWAKVFLMRGSAVAKKLCAGMDHLEVAMFCTDGSVIQSEGMRALELH